MFVFTTSLVADRVPSFARRTSRRSLICLLFATATTIAALATTSIVRAQLRNAFDAEVAHPPVASSTVQLTNREWRKLLTKEQFEILRRAGTEPAFENRYFDFKGYGTYACVACGNRLFSSDSKFDSGTGWPSFTKPLDDAAVSEKPDHSGGMRRIEVTCTRCGGHLGHVFDDGPEPTGLRYCMNSAALTFFPDHHAERTRVSELDR